MKHIGKIVSKTLLIANILLALAMILSAWSPWLVDPRQHPMWSLGGFALPFLFILNLGFIFLWLIFKWQYALLSLITFVCCQEQLKAYCPIQFKEEEIPENAIKILSYNVMGFGKLLKDKTEDKNPILSYIKKQDPDIVCMQEYRYAKGEDPHQLSEKDIKKVLNYPYYVCLETSESHTIGNYLAVFSKYPILSSQSIPFKHSANGSAIYEILVGKDTITLVNNHLESNKLTKADKKMYEEIIKNPEKENVSEGAKMLLKKLAEATSIRASQADTIAEILKKRSRPTVIICGDFNDIPVSYSHRIMQGKRKDAYIEAGSGPGISYNQNKFYFRIDNILISDNLKALKCRVDRSIKDSDHYPIWAYLVQKNH